jgi:WD40 repeat protein
MFTRMVRLIALPLLLLTMPLFAAAPDEKAEEEYKHLAERAAAPGADPAKLIQDVQAFRLAHAGTPQAVRAGGLLRQIPSPLDKLDASTIPELERFAWQPKELVAVLGEHRGRHAAAVSSVALSGDGTIGVSGGGHLVRLWDTKTLRLRGLGGHGAVTSVVISPDGKTVASASAYGTVVVWDVVPPETLRARFTINVSTTAVYCVAMHPDGTTIATAAADNVVNLWDITGKEGKNVGSLNVHKMAVHAVAFSPDGKWLVSGGEEPLVKVWALGQGQPEEKATIQQGKPVRTLLFSPKGGTFAVALSDGTTAIWPMPPAKAVPTLVIPTPKDAGFGGALAFSPSGQNLAVSYGDQSVRVWGTTAPLKERAVIKGHSGNVTGLVYSPDGKGMLTGSADWTVRSWDLTTPTPTDRFKPWSHLSAVYCSAFSPDGQTLATGSHDTILRLWDLTKTEPRTRNFLKPEISYIYTVSYAPDGKTVVAAGNATHIRQWDAASGRLLRSGEAPAAVQGLLHSPDGRHVLAICYKEALLYDGKMSLRYSFNTHKTNVTCMAFSPDGRTVLTGSGYYEYKDGNIVIRDGKYVYTDCCLRVWDVEKGVESQTLKDFTTPVYAVGFAADGKQAFGGVYEPILRRYDVGPKNLTATKEGELKGASGYFAGLVFSADGALMVSRTVDYKVIVWDLASGKRLREWALPETVQHVAIAPDSRHLAVSLSTGVVYVMRLPK